MSRPKGGATSAMAPSGHSRYVSAAAREIDQRTAMILAPMNQKGTTVPYVHAEPSK